MLYGTEGALGDALVEAFSTGLVKREEIFVTTKLWITDNHPAAVLPALRTSLW
jgi:polyketide reductase